MVHNDSHEIVLCTVDVVLEVEIPERKRERGGYDFTDVMHSV